MRLTQCFAIAVTFVLVMTGPAVRAQDRSCVNQLVPCLNYLNGTRDPPDSCCSPLKNVIRNNPECLCSLIGLKGTRDAERAGINITLAQQLPGRCGQRINSIGCLRASPSSKNSVPSAASSSISPKSLVLAATLSVTLQAL